MIRTPEPPNDQAQRTRPAEHTSETTGTAAADGVRCSARLGRDEVATAAEEDLGMMRDAGQRIGGTTDEVGRRFDGTTSETEKTKAGAEHGGTTLGR